MKLCVSKLAPPITKLPDTLFFVKHVNKVMKPEVLNYAAVSTKGDKNYGEVSVFKHHSTRDDYNGDEIVIYNIKSENPKQGLGTDMIEFVKNYSKQNGCNGYVSLFAYVGYTPDEIPHIFYRKCGFSTLDENLDHKLDFFIEKDLSATMDDFKNMHMYYPAAKEDLTTLQKMKKFFNQIICKKSLDE